MEDPTILELADMEGFLRANPAAMDKVRDNPALQIIIDRIEAE